MSEKLKGFGTGKAPQGKAPQMSQIGNLKKIGPAKQSSIGGTDKGAPAGKAPTAYKHQGITGNFGSKGKGPDGMPKANQKDVNMKEVGKLKFSNPVKQQP